MADSAKRSYWFRKYVISLVVFVFGIYFAKNLVGGDTLLDWIMSTIVAGIFGLVNFAWWKGREGGVDEAGMKVIEEVKSRSLEEAGSPLYTAPGIAGSPDLRDDLK